MCSSSYLPCRITGKRSSFPDWLKFISVGNYNGLLNVNLVIISSCKGVFPYPENIFLLLLIKVLPFASLFAKINEMIRYLDEGQKKRV